MEPPQLVLIDFGHAEFVDKKQIKEGYSKYGTCFYLCPEGYLNYYSSKSDIWSLGICLYLFITGDYPFYGDDEEYEQNVVNKNIKLDIDKLSPNVICILDACLNYNPKERATIDEITKLLSK